MPNTLINYPSDLNPIVKIVSGTSLTDAATALNNNFEALANLKTSLSNVTNDAQLKSASNLSDVASASTARTNLGLGSAATHASTDFVASTAVGVAGGVADLDGSGKLPTSRLPAIDIGSYLGSFATQAAMLAVTGANPGDWCNRSDISTTWVLTATPASTLGNWIQLSYPTAAVTTVAGRTGNVTIGYTDVSGLSTVAHTGAYADLSSPPTLGTAAAHDVGYFDLAGAATTAAAAVTCTTLSAVPTSRTVNGHALTANVTVTAGDLSLGNLTNDKQVKGLSTGTTSGHVVTWGADGYTVGDGGGLGTAASHAATDFDAAGAAAAVTCTTLGAVPTSRTVNGHALTANVTVTAGDLGLGNVTNDAQLKSASNLSDLASASTARTNLGLGTAATHDSTDFAAASAVSGTNTGDVSVQYASSAVYRKASTGVRAGDYCIQQDTQHLWLFLGGTVNSDQTWLDMGLSTGGLTLLSSSATGTISGASVTGGHLWLLSNQLYVSKAAAITEFHLAANLGGGVVLAPCTALTSVTVDNSGLTGLVLPTNGAAIKSLHAAGNAISQDGVNNILTAVAAYAVASNVAKGTVDLSGGTNGAPSGGGITAMNILTGMSWSVTTN